MKIVPRYSSGVAYLAANVAVVTLNISIIPFLVSHLSPEEYGRVGVFSLLVSIFTTLIGLDTLSALTRKIYDDPIGLENRARLTSTVVSVTIATGLLFAGVGEGIVYMVPAAYSLVLSYDWLWMAALTAMALSLMRVRQVHWQVDNKAFRFATTQVLNVGLAALLTIALIVQVWPTALSRVLAICTAALLLSVYSLVSLHRDGYLGRQYVTLKTGQDLLAYGLPLMPHSLGLFLVSSLDRIFVASWTSLAQFGVYLLATQVGLGVQLFLDGINTALVPRIFSKLEGSESMAVSRQRLKPLLRLAYAFPVIMLALAASVAKLVQTFYPVGFYSAAVTPAVALVLAFSLLAPIYVVSNIALFHNQTKKLSFNTLLSGGVNLVLLIVLTQHLGINGAATASVLANGFRLALLLRMVR